MNADRNHSNESTQWAHAVIVSGSFKSGYSYQENVWAESLSRMGWTVTVLCPKGRSQSSDQSAIEFIEVASYGLERRQLLLETDVARHIVSLRPDCILWFGPPQLFGLSMARELAVKAIPTAIFMGQNSRMQTFDWRTKGLGLKGWLKASAYRYIRGPAIRKAIDIADLVVANTAETPRILGLYDAPTNFSHKLMMKPLGFDPDTFKYNPRIRTRSRTDMGLAEDSLTFLLSSRFAAEKELSIQLIWHAFERLAQTNEHVQLIVTGLDDKAISKRFIAQVETSSVCNQVHLHSFLDRSALAGVYHAADVAVFARPSISCQETLGAGAFGLFSDDGSMDWLLTDDECGQTFPQADADALLGQMLDLQANAARLLDERQRIKRAAKASFLSYDRIIDDVLTRLQQQSSTDH
ncbi:MAG: glycosyltransferase [Myxococcota bacterium]|nr:glycosyltransferase [Myxococcota bacterium]